MLDREQIVQTLRGDLAGAQKRRNVASRLLGSVLRDATPDAAELVQWLSSYYGKTQRQVIAALARLDQYLAYGTIPDELKNLGLRRIDAPSVDKPNSLTNTSVEGQNR